MRWGWFTLRGRSDSFYRFRRRKPFKFSSARVLEFKMPAGAGLAAPLTRSFEVLMYCLPAPLLLVILYSEFISSLALLGFVMDPGGCVIVHF